MKYLIDTQILIWLFGDTGKLSPTTTNLIQDSKNSIVVSIASFWEIAIKSSLNKLKLPFDLPKLVEETLSNNIDLLDIEMAHILAVANMPFHHGDPFDRIIIAQAISENLDIVSSDKTFDAYGIKRTW